MLWLSLSFLSVGLMAKIPHDRFVSWLQDNVCKIYSWNMTGSCGFAEKKKVLMIKFLTDWLQLSKLTVQITIINTTKTCSKKVQMSKYHKSTKVSKDDDCINTIEQWHDFDRFSPNTAALLATVWNRDKITSWEWHFILLFYNFFFFSL